jgi:hypothetical protein
MNFELLRIGIALAGTGIAAWQDQKTSFIDDRLTVGMIAAGIILNLISFDFSLITFSLGIALIIFALGFVSYKTGQLGGGDVLLLVALQLLLPFYPNALTPILPQQLVQVPYPFIASIFLASAFFGLVGTSVFYAVKVAGLKKLKPNYLNLFIMLALIAFFFAATLLTPFSKSPLQIVFYLAVLLPAAFFYTFRQQIMDEVVVKRVRIKEIEEEDILATDRMPEKLVDKYGLGKVLTKKEVEKLKKMEAREKMHLFPVYKVLPRFGPYILAGLVVSLVLKDLILFVFLY